MMGELKATGFKPDQSDQLQSSTVNFQKIIYFITLIVYEGVKLKTNGRTNVSEFSPSFKGAVIQQCSILQRDETISHRFGECVMQRGQPS